jgi:hypothetical protein
MESAKEERLGYQAVDSSRMISQMHLMEEVLRSISAEVAFAVVKMFAPEMPESRFVLRPLLSATVVRKAAVPETLKAPSRLFRCPNMLLGLLKKKLSSGRSFTRLVAFIRVTPTARPLFIVERIIWCLTFGAPP